MRLLVALTTALLLLLAGPAAQAAPVSRPASFTLELGALGLGSLYVYTPSGGAYICYSCFPEIQIQATGTISVDSAAGTVSLAAGAITLPQTITYGVGGTSIASLKVERLTNLTGTFAVGGAAGHAGEPPCPLSGTGACVPQTGFGGIMGLTGTYFVTIIPNIVVLPVALGPLGRAGTATAGGYTYDPAPWTVGTARISQPGTLYSSFSYTTTGFVTADAFRLVAPTYVLALGNVLPFFSFLTVELTDGLGVPGFVSGAVPEPGVWLLWLGAATAGGGAAARVGRRR
jgi:hypothetical protein